MAKVSTWDERLCKNVHLFVPIDYRHCLLCLDKMEVIVMVTSAVVIATQESLKTEYVLISISGLTTCIESDNQLIMVSAILLSISFSLIE